MSWVYWGLADISWTQQETLSSAHRISYTPSETSRLAQKLPSHGYGRDPREQIQLPEHIFSLAFITSVRILLAKARHMAKPNINETCSFYESKEEEVGIIEE